MHGFKLGYIFLVNAEVDSMRGKVDSGVGIGPKSSLCRAAIEKAQAELRLEYDVREERKRELEFLEKGGDPLDFKFGHAASASVQSTSLAEQQPDQNLTSEAKGSFALTASPHGDSIESSGRLGITIACEPNSADNFEGGNEILQSDRKSMCPGRSNITPSEHSSQLDKSQNGKDSEDSPIFHPKKGQAYRRRNRSRINRDGPCSSSADTTSCGGHGSSMPARHAMLSKPVASENQLEIELVGAHVMHSTTSRVTEFAEGKVHLSNSKEKLDEAQNPSLKVDEAPITIGTVETAIVVGRDSIDTLDVECPFSSGAGKTEDNAKSAQLNETSKVNGDDKCIPTDAIIISAPVMAKGLDSESSHTQINVCVDGNGNGNGNIGSDFRTNLNNADSNGAPKEHTLPFRENSVSRDDKMRSQDHVTNVMETASCIKEDQSSISHLGNGFTEDHAEVDKAKSSLQDEAEGLSTAEGQEIHGDAEIKSEKELGQCDDCVPKMGSSCHVIPPLDPVSNELISNVFFGPSPVLDSQPCTENQPKSLDTAQEDRILEEARIIEAKHKRIAELSIGLLPTEYRQRCHWDLVLEEMAWLANDFAQERLWKMTAATQICRRAAFASRIRLEEQSKFLKQKSVAHTLAKAVMVFWHSARISVENADVSPLEKCNNEASSGAHEMVLMKSTDKASPDRLQCSRRDQDRAVYGYAVRFLQFNCSPKSLLEVEVSGMTDVACDFDLPEVSWQDQFTEENLFYAVPPGAMEVYRKLIESNLAEYQRICNNIQEEVVTSSHIAEAECGYEDNDYEEGENLYYHPQALVSGKPSNKKRKNMKSDAARSYELGGDVGYGHCAGTRNGPTQFSVTVKGPANNLHVDLIPTKRMHTASRQKVVGAFGAGPAGVTPMLSGADASSEDTNSFQDDQSTLHGGSIVPRGSEVDSKMNFEKQSTFDSAEMSTKPKKKKKSKHQSLSYDQRWQLDSSMQNEQKNLVRKRLDNYQLESNGNGSLFGQHAKKSKLAKHSLDNSLDNTAPMSRSVASPVASQMSNLSSQAKMIKFIGGRDSGKKGKGLKVSIGQFGSGSPWTIVEDQALVVLVHDMGPNWELVSDAINSILQFKCIFRKPQECKERHKFLMDSPSGDGADSEDSGSSQPYPSTLPGIPKGSARQLFRSLHAHVEEDNIKSRFEKIIRIEQLLQTRKKKVLKQILPAHGSHVLSLSQVIPNNVNGGVLTPLDLCDTATSNQEPPSIGYTSSHAGGSSLPNQSSIPPTHPPSSLNSSLQGSPTMGTRNNLLSPPSQFTSTRDARYSVSRSGSLPIEEQQGLHQYNSVLSGRNVQASNLSSGSISGSSDRGVRMHPDGNGVGMMPGMNQSIPMARPGVQGIPSSSMLNSGSVLASSVGGLPSNMNVHSGTASSHGKTMFRPRDSLHGVRSGKSSEHQRQMVLPEMQIQATQSNSPGVPSFGGPSSGFSNNQTTTPLQTYPGHHHPHVLNIPEQQAYIHISRERQIQQSLLHRQHQQHPASSSALVTHVQTPSQLPVSSPSLMTHVGPVPHQQLKNIQGLVRSAQSGPGGLINQAAKQRQRQAQQYQQSGRQHPQQSPQTPKLMKGIGRGNMAIQQNVPIDPSRLNGLNSANSASQVAEKGDPALHLRQCPDMTSGSTLNTLPPSKPLVSPPTSSHTQHQKSPLKVVDQSQPALQRTSQQNRQVNSDSLTNSQVDHSLTKQKSSRVVPSPACVDSASNARDSTMTSESSPSGLSTSQAVMSSLSNEPLSSVGQGLVVEKQSSGNNLVSHGLEAQWQQQE